MRFVLHLVREGGDAMEELALALDESRQNVALCDDCRGLAEKESVCRLCGEPGRANGLVCVVESIADLISMEATGLFSGRYFVLHRLLSPLKGVGPDDLRLPRLMARIERDHVEEVILATPLTTDGETTATYLSRVLTRAGVRVTRLAAGVPVGGSIEYLDRMTLTRAFQDRKEL